MSSEPTPDQRFRIEAEENAMKARKYGLVFISLGVILQILHVFSLPIQGITIMLIIAGIVLIGGGILFIVGSYTVPKTRAEFIRRFQKTMLDHNPERRLWAAQRLIGYAKDANFGKEEILSLTRHAVKMVKDPNVANVYKPYVSVDHIILIREMAVNLNMDKHTRKEFVRIVKPLAKEIENIDDDAYEILADAIAFHPDKLPIQAYDDLRKQKEELGK